MRKLTVRAIDVGQAGPNACSSPGYVYSVAVFPAAFSAARLVRDQAIGQVESDSPWWISTGSVTRSKKFTADMLRQLAHVIASLLSSPAGNAMRAVKCEAFSDPELARAVDERFQAPRRQALIDLLHRGVRRGEVRPGADCALVADVLPAMLAHRVILMREAIAESEITDIIEQIVLPLIEVR